MSTNSNEPKRKRLSKEELRNCKGFENYSDEQAENTIDTLEKLSILFFELYMKKINQQSQLKSLKDEK